jgi:hypothetical protein
MTAEMRVIALGVHVVDVLVRPVQEIPAGRAGNSCRTSASPPPARRAEPR